MAVSPEYNRRHHSDHRKRDRRSVSRDRRDRSTSRDRNRRRYSRFRSRDRNDNRRRDDRRHSHRDRSAQRYRKDNNRRDDRSRDDYNRDQNRRYEKRHRTSSRSPSPSSSGSNDGKSPSPTLRVPDKIDVSDGYGDVKKMIKDDKPYKPNIANQEKDQRSLFWEMRREEREKIGEKTTTQLWSASPEPELFKKPDEQKTDEPRKKSKKSKKSKSGGDEEKSKSKKHKKHKKKKKKRIESESQSDSEQQQKTSSKKHEIDMQGLDDEAREFVKQFQEKQRKTREENHHDDDDDSSDSSGDSESYGPLPKGQVAQLNQREFGKALLPGEGAAMAAYIAEGKRIPRRGEIGLTPDEIAQFEDVGYVMSGSRHRRMEAVRLRKENQIYSADEKRALQMFNKDERAKRETKILSQFKDMVKSKTSASAAAASSASSAGAGPSSKS